MAVKTTTTTETLAEGYGTARDKAVNVKRLGVSLNNDIAAGTAQLNSLVNYATTLADAIGRIGEIAGLSGIVAYVKEQEADNAYEVGAEFTALVAQCVVVRNLITGNVPVSGNGFIEEKAFNGDGTYSQRLMADVFSAGQLTAFKNALSALIATVE